MSGIERNYVCNLLLIFVLLIFLLFGCGGRDAVFKFVDIEGNEIEADSDVDITDPIIVKLSNLEEDSYYRVRVYDSDGERVYTDDLILISNSVTDDDGKVSGEIPDTIVAFLGSTDEAQVVSKFRHLGKNLPSGIRGLGREVSIGKWCVNIFEYRGGSVTGKKCLNVTNTGKRVFTTDSAGSSYRSFLLSSGNVYVKGQNFDENSEVDLYVMNNTSGFLSKDEQIHDERGLSKTTLTANDSGTFFGLFWSLPARVGLYDIVVDVDQNGLWNSDVDLVAKAGIVPGFAVHDKGVLTYHNRTQLACGSYGGGYCTYKDFFIEEDLYVMLNPLTQPAKSFDDPAPKLYIMSHKDTWSTGDELSTLEDLNEAVIRFPAQVGTYASGRVLAYPQGLSQAGCYDVIADTNNNEKYDTGQDFLDQTDLGGNKTCGFNVPGAEGAPSVKITKVVDGSASDITSSKKTESGTVSLQGMVTATTINASYITVESGVDFSQLSFTSGGSSFNTELFPIFTGEDRSNRITVFFMDSEKRVGYARVTVTSEVEVTRALEMELSWSIPSGASASDLDIHLVRPGKKYFDNDGDCYYQTCKLEDYPSGLDWDADGNSANNPKLEVDCISDCVRVENIYMDEVTVLTDYNVYVDAHNGKGTPSIKIYINGSKVSEFSASCGTLESSATGNKDTWHVGTITKSAGGLAFTKVDICGTEASFQ